MSVSPAEGQDAATACTPGRLRLRLVRWLGAALPERAPAARGRARLRGRRELVPVVSWARYLPDEETAIDEHVAAHLGAVHGLRVSLAAARRVRERTSSSSKPTIEVAGFALLSGVPERVSLSSAEIRALLAGAWSVPHLEAGETEAPAGGRILEN
ncbi:MAG: hypothetical protein HYZ53_10870 [Planctomycetes bacterium]|nr:hypothetical protein [Planctomycetota bacterium]